VAVQRKHATCIVKTEQIPAYIMEIIRGSVNNPLLHR